MWTITDKICKGDTLHNSLLFGKDGRIEYLYFGKKINTRGEYDILRPESDFWGNRIPLAPLSSYGDGDFRTPSFVAVSSSEVSAFRFSFVGAERSRRPDISPLPCARGEGDTLKVSYFDEAHGVLLNEYFTLFDDCDVVICSREVVNRGRGSVFLKKIDSLQFELWGKDKTFVTFDGSWGYERQKHETALSVGKLVNESVTGSSSPFHNPFVMVKDETCVYAFNLIYSGNHKESLESDDLGRSRVLVGMNEFLFDWEVKPSSRFCTPEAVMTVGESEEQVSLFLHDFVKKHILPEKWANRERPVLVNNWEGTEFSFTAEKIKAIIDRSAEAGAELFVLDDGWFGHRDGDNSSLGDWLDYTQKTGGLKNLADYARAKGLSFGIWVEPEMISEDSELYRRHPEYAMRSDREPFRIRNQLMLDLTNPEVCEYIYQSVKNVILLCRAAYVKWDYNRFMTDCYGKEIPAGEYFHRYLLGLYGVLRRLTEEFPDVLFESCASGGARFDLGMLFFMPQTWVSDDTDARERLFIQGGTSYAYPISSFGSHVSSSPNLQSGNSHCLETRFNVAVCGNLGYEMDLTKCSQEELSLIREQISFYKAHRKTFAFGKFYRIGDIFRDNVTGYVFAGEEESIAVVAVKQKRVGEKNIRFRMRGLDENALYAVQTRKQRNYAKEYSYVAGGDVLMNGSLVLDGIFDDESLRENSSPLYTRMIIFQKIS